jgi:hypothetical protein
MRYLITINKIYQFFFDRWTVSVEEYPYHNKVVVTYTNRFNGKQKIVVKTLR